MICIFCFFYERSDLYLWSSTLICSIEQNFYAFYFGLHCCDVFCSTRLKDSGIFFFFFFFMRPRIGPEVAGPAGPMEPDGAGLGLGKKPV